MQCPQAVHESGLWTRDNVPSPLSVLSGASRRPRVGLALFGTGFRVANYVRALVVRFVLEELCG